MPDASCASFSEQQVVRVVAPTIKQENGFPAEVLPLPLSGWCNPTRPTLPPLYRSRPHSKSLGSASCGSPCKLHPNRPLRVHRCPTCLAPSRDSHLEQRPASNSPTFRASAIPCDPSKFELNPAALEFCPKARKQTHNPLGGKLVTVCVMFFERAYGLNGQKKTDHTILKQEMMSLTGCSERAVQAVLYGSSYNELLGKLRAQVPGYVSQKAADGQDFSLLPYYSFDGNTLAPIVTELAKVEESAPECVVPPVATRAETPAVVVEQTTSAPSAPVTPSLVTQAPPLARHYPTMILLALAAVLPLTTWLY